MFNQKNIQYMIFRFFLYSLICLTFFSCTSSKKLKNDNGMSVLVKTESGLQYQDIETGSGKTPADGDKVSIHLKITDEKGFVIENSYQTQKPVVFTIGKEEVIKGLEEGVKTMKTGGKRKLIIPPEIGFGVRTFRNIPSNSNLIMDVELLEIK